MLSQTLVRESLEVSEPTAEAIRRSHPRRSTPDELIERARDRRVAIFGGLLLILAASALRVSLLAARPAKPDWPMVFQGFSEALSADQLARLANDTGRGRVSREEFMMYSSKIETPKPPCMTQVDECLNPEGPSSLADLDGPHWPTKSLANAEGFFERLDDCLTRAAQCAREAETEAADRALAAANADLRSAVQILEAGGAAGVAQLAGAFKGASAAVARDFPFVAAFLRDVAERVLAFLRRYLPIWAAAAKEIGGEFAEKLLALLEVLQDRLPGLANQCKCGLGEGAKVVKEASTAAVSLLQADLPRWTAEAEKAGKGAVAFAERLLKDVPKVVDMCKTELEKQLAKEGQQAMIKKALMVGAAVGAVGFWMHHHHTETQKKREELEHVSAGRRSLRAKASESRALGWPAEHVLAGLYRHGFWEDFGREAVRILDERPASLRTFENRSRDDELSELFLQPWNAPYR